MDTTMVVVAVILAAVAVAGFLVYRGSGGAGIKIGPFSLDFRGSNPPHTLQAPLSGARVRGSRSKRGAIRATDTTGRGSDVLDSTAHGDIEATTSSAEASSDPKGRAPQSKRPWGRPST